MYWGGVYTIPVCLEDDCISKQVAQLSQRDRAAGWVSYDQKWKTETERLFTDIVSLYSAIVQELVPYSQRYLFNAIPDTNHNDNPTNPNTRYRCE